MLDRLTNQSKNNPSGRYARTRIGLLLKGTRPLQPVGRVHLRPSLFRGYRACLLPVAPVNGRVYVSAPWYLLGCRVISYNKGRRFYTWGYYDIVNGWLCV